MAKKARFYKVHIRTAYRDHEIFYIPVPAPTKYAAEMLIKNHATNVLKVEFMGWFDIRIEHGGYVERSDMAVFGMSLPNGKEFYYGSNEPGWDYLCSQFQKKLDDFIDENNSDY
ncbi:MAG: hypothetical protein E6X49_09100 [Leclercia adecarboxylata]|nr:hypothetical protein [uncultured Leclercia sp.]MDU4841292.1 hypothetical protein [Leclercia adecarboxylata]